MSSLNQHETARVTTDDYSTVSVAAFRLLLTDPNFHHVTTFGWTPTVHGRYGSVQFSCCCPSKAVYPSISHPVTLHASGDYVCETQSKPVYSQWTSQAHCPVWPTTRYATGTLWHHALILDLYLLVALNQCRSSARRRIHQLMSTISDIKAKYRIISHNNRSQFFIPLHNRNVLPRSALDGHWLAMPRGVCCQTLRVHSSYLRQLNN